MPLKFNKSDFENLIFSNIFVNQTSGTECKDPNFIELIEVSKTGITLKVPKTLNNIDRNQDVLFSGIGKIKEKIITDKEKESEVKIEFSQFDKNHWKKIVSNLQNKQNSMMKLLDKIKVTEA